MLQTYRNIILSEAAYGGLPVGYWPLDEVNGTTAADLMAQARGTGYNGTYTGGYTLGVAGPISREASRGVTLNGTNAYVDCSNNAALTPAALTLEAWVRPITLTQTYMPIFNKNGATGGYAALYLKSNGRVAIYLSSTGGGVFYDGSGSFTQTVGNWYHIAATYSSTAGLVGYVNGRVDATAAAAGTLTASIGALLIGNDLINANRILNATVAHAALYNYAVAAHRINAHYLAGINGIPQFFNRIRRVA